MIALYLCANVMKIEINVYSPLPPFCIEKKTAKEFQDMDETHPRNHHLFRQRLKRNHFCHILTYDDFPYRSRVMARRVKIDMLTVKQEVKELKLQVSNCSTFQISSFNVSSRLFAIFSGFQSHGSSFFCSF